MRLFECSCCQQPLFFEHSECEKCGRRLGYLPEQNRFVAISRNDEWVADGGRGPIYQLCRNARYGACNWLVSRASCDEDSGFCTACRHNRTIPDLAFAKNRERWLEVERAKHRLIYGLLRLGLPLPTRADDPYDGLAFDFLDEDLSRNVRTGHDRGLITISLAEADDGERERRRNALGEPYRTLLGHLRHEAGHFYWDRLVENRPAIPAFRAYFGDERADYEEALATHYNFGSPRNWHKHYVSAYASSHPWEDFAETFAHYLHIVDTLDTARAFRLSVRKGAAIGEMSADEPSTEVSCDPYRAAGINELIEDWLPLSFAFNSVNRSMGQRDLYPFVLSPPAIEKLAFVHDLIAASGAAVPMLLADDFIAADGLTGL